MGNTQGSVDASSSSLCDTSCESDKYAPLFTKPHTKIHHGLPTNVTHIAYDHETSILVVASSNLGLKFYGKHNINYILPYKEEFTVEYMDFNTSSELYVFVSNEKTNTVLKVIYDSHHQWIWDKQLTHL